MTPAFRAHPELAGDLDIRTLAARRLALAFVSVGTVGLDLSCRCTAGHL